MCCRRHRRYRRCRRCRSNSFCVRFSLSSFIYSIVQIEFNLVVFRLCFVAVVASPLIGQQQTALFDSSHYSIECLDSFFVLEFIWSKFVCMYKSSNALALAMTSCCFCHCLDVFSLRRLATVGTSHIFFFSFCRYFVCIVFRTM